MHGYGIDEAKKYDVTNKPTPEDASLVCGLKKATP